MSVPKVEFPGAESRTTVKTRKRGNVKTGRASRPTDMPRLSLIQRGARFNFSTLLTF
jgi:hypothetical protein